MSNINKIRNAGLHALGALALGALALPAAAQGQADGGTGAEKELEVIVVTARKREEKLTDVVGSVTALTEERLRDLNIESIDDVAKFTPGLSFSKAFGRATERPVIRGAANILAGTAAHAESGASYYVNGVYFQGDIQSLDPNLLQRVEVLKGPQSASYGRNAYAGAVNFVFKDLVGEDFDASVKAGLGLFGEGSDRTELTASVRAPLGDNFGVMASFRSYDYGGEYENRVTGETIGNEGTTAITFGWQWKTDNHNLRMYLLTNTDEDGTRALALQRSDMNNCYPGFRSNVIRSPAADGSQGRGTEISPVPDNPFQYFCGVVQALDYVRLNDAPIPTVDPGAGNRADDAATPFSGVERDRTVTMLQYTYDFGGPGTLDVNVGLRSEELTTGSDSDHWDLQFYSAGAGNPPEDDDYPLRRSFFQFGGVDEYDDTSIEVRFTSNQEEALRWSAGFFNYSWSRTAKSYDWLYDWQTVERTITGTVDASNPRACNSRASITTDCYTDGDLSVDYLGLGFTPVVDDYDLSNLAIFGSVEYDLNDAHTVGFEARWASEDKGLRDISYEDKNPATDSVETQLPVHPSDFTTGTRAIPVSEVATVLSKEDTQTFDSITYRLSYRWRYSDNGSFYASYATGNKPGGVNNAEATRQMFADFEEEESTNIEVGAKHTMLNGRLYLAGSYFINDITKFQLTTPLSDPFGLIASAVSNQGDAEVSGFELEVRALIGDIMDLGFAFTSINPEITEGCDPFHYILTSGGYLYGDATTPGHTLYDAIRNPGGTRRPGSLDGATCDIAGKQIPLTSDTQWAVDANWAMPLNNLLLTWGGNIAFESSKFAQVHNGMETGDATEIGVHVGITNAAETWAVRLIGTNITDEDAPVALTRWADYGQGTPCNFSPSAPCSSISSTEFEAAQQAHLQGHAAFRTSSTADLGSPRGPFMSLRQRSRWVVNFTYNF